MGLRGLRLILTRHGETVENASDIVQGHLNGSLSEVGRAQARKLRTALTSEEIDAVYASDLDRAAETAKIASGSQPGRPAVVHDERLREQSFGIYEGEPIETLLDEMKAQGAEWSTFHPLGGESRPTLSERAKAFIETMKQRHEDENILVVTHYGIINSLLKMFSSGDFATKDIEIRNGSITILTIDGSGRASFDIVNGTDHLTAPITG